MPEGLNSIEDLKVVITAETEKLSEGLGNAQTIINRFGREADTSLKAFDASVSKSGTSVTALLAPLNRWIAMAGTALGLIERIGAAGERAAKAAGLGEEYDQAARGVAAIGEAFADLTKGQDNTRERAAYVRRSIADVRSDFAETGKEAEDVFGAALRRIGEMGERAAHEVRRLNPHPTWSAATFDSEIVRTNERLEQLREQISALQRTGSVSPIEALFGRDAEESLRRLGVEASNLGSSLAWLAEQRTKAQWRDVDQFDASAFQKSIDAEVESLRLKAASLGMATAEAEAYVKTQRLMVEVAKGSVRADDVEGIRQQIAAMRALRQQIEGHAEAKRAQQQAERDADRQDKGEQQIVHGAERELNALRAKQNALGGATAATKAAEVEERLLEQARSRNLVVTDALALQIRSYAESIGRAEDQLRQHQRTVDTVNQAMGSVFRTAETAFDRFTSGAKMKGKDMVESLLRDLERLLFRLLIIKPLQESITGAASSFINTGFGGIGARAEGGPVSRGVPYLVGERGPELMVPESYGSIIPNHGLRSGAASAGGPVNVSVNISAPAGTGARETGRRQDGNNLSLDIMIEQFEGAMAQRVAEGTSPLGGAIEGRFGLSSAAGAR